MAKLYTLSEEDIGILKEVVRDYQGRKSAHSNTNIPRTNMAPGCYLALVEAAGIPALSDTTPGSAICDIYRINPTTPSVEEVGTDREVFNVTTSDIAAGYVPVVCTKGGQWVVSAGGSEGMKKFCRWQAQEDFTTLDEWWWATIEVQYGPGTEHTEGGTGTGGAAGVSGKIYNLLRPGTSTNTYEFYGVTGIRGTAFWHQDDEWVCIIPNCPEP